MYYIATFYSHFGAIRFKKEMPHIKNPKLSPVPRTLSSSCGTCVRFEAETPPAVSELSEEVEQLARESANGYEIIYRAE
jgi:hypothetical protein